MTERDVLSYPQSLIECSTKLLYNPSLLSTFVKVLFLKTNVYVPAMVQDSFNILSSWFEFIWDLRKSLPPSFDEDFFIQGMQILLDDPVAVSVAKGIGLLYTHFSLLSRSIRKCLIYRFLLKERFVSLFYHWSADVRSVFHYLLIYKILAHSEINFDTPETSKYAEQLERQLKGSLASRNSSFGELQRPYITTAEQEWATIHSGHKDWLAALPKEKSLALYPVISVTLSHFDLTEEKLNEEW